VSRARLDPAAVPAHRHKARPRTALPARITDNLDGRTFDPSKVAREVAFICGPEILKRLNRIQRAADGVTPAGSQDVPPQNFGLRRVDQAEPQEATEPRPVTGRAAESGAHGRSGPNHSSGGKP